MNQVAQSIFYFNYRRGDDLLLDEEGVRCTGVAEAHSKAVACARALLSADILCGWLDLDQEIVITSGDGTTSLSLPFEKVLEARPSSGRRSLAAAVPSCPAEPVPGNRARALGPSMKE